MYAQDQQQQQPEQHAGFMNRMKSLVGASSNAPGRQVVVHSSCFRTFRTTKHSSSRTPPRPYGASMLPEFNMLLRIAGVLYGAGQ